MGGDEFLVILPMTTAAEAVTFVQRAQRAVARVGIEAPEYGLPTLSIGIAEAPRHGATRELIMAAADAALYRAKRAGRDTVELAEDP
jgi:diguanylate cyclase (GGDEF)-like protein